MNKHKVFSISKGVACPLKWSWNTVRLAEATTACCHRVKPVALDIDDFDNFHNYDTWVQHREMMLEGRFPEQGCEQYCGHIEKQGGMSDRLFQMSQAGFDPPELETDPEATRTTPRALEVFINNACNLACIYCDESNSTRIQKENQKFGYSIPGTDRPVIPITPKTQDYKPLVEKFFGYLDRNYHHLNRLLILGGEPFYQREFFRLADYVSQGNNPELRFTVVSNLMVSRNILEEFVEKMKQALIDRRLGRLDITASIDCFGPEQEFVRYGIELEQWRENFEFLASHRWIYLNINNTITSLTIKTLPDLLDYINDLREKRPIHHAFGLVDFKMHMHPKIFGMGYFDKDFQKILSRMPTENTWDSNRKDYMMGLIKSVNAHTPDWDLQHDLRCYLDELDRRRNLDWKSVFPWLAEHFDRIANVV
jgi:MoaA/NifB/PqqE/SkfB family radical SAM enzyme